MRASLVIVSLLALSFPAHGEDRSADPQGSVPTTEKGQPIAPTGASQPASPPGSQAPAPVDSSGAQTNGPGSAGTSSNPLAHGSTALTAQDGLHPENGVYSATDGKDRKQTPR